MGEQRSVIDRTERWALFPVAPTPFQHCHPDWRLGSGSVLIQQLCKTNQSASRSTSSKDNNCLLYLYLLRKHGNQERATPPSACRFCLNKSSLPDKMFFYCYQQKVLEWLKGENREVRDTVGLGFLWAARGRVMATCKRFKLNQALMVGHLIFHLKLQSSGRGDGLPARRLAAAPPPTQKPLKGWYLPRPARLSGDAGVCGRWVRPEALSGWGVGGAGGGWNEAGGINRRRLRPSPL